MGFILEEIESEIFTKEKNRVFRSIGFFPL